MCHGYFRSISRFSSLGTASDLGGGPPGGQDGTSSLGSRCTGCMRHQRYGSRTPVVLRLGRCHDMAHGLRSTRRTSASPLFAPPRPVRHIVPPVVRLRVPHSVQPVLPARPVGAPTALRAPATALWLRAPHADRRDDSSSCGNSTTDCTGPCQRATHHASPSSSAERDIMSARRPAAAAR